MEPTELLKIIPEAVHTHDIDINSEGETVITPVEEYGIKYNQLIPVLIDAIQEQHQHIQEQHTLLKNLESRILQLENK